MSDFDGVVWTSGLLTWVIGQDVVLADDITSKLFGLDPDECGKGTQIETFLARVIEADRPRVAKELYRCIAEGCDYLEAFEVLSEGGRSRRLVAKGSAVGDVLFTCIITEWTDSRSALERLCLAAYEAARQANNDIVAYRLMQSVVALEGTGTRSCLH
ncbi:hypothetical protein [Rhizobium sp. BG4]|uniref:hypothetical protein n=1 Tax=Rhizobium sp. BG4 TaxID=2613770 RepID=UPI00193DD51E|nr:hypothetical protein [Rhizobium sp. BG4]QRM45792.1 PAS domain-containing protein [Rhizobium sp. BG4]